MFQHVSDLFLHVFTCFSIFYTCCHKKSFFLETTLSKYIYEFILENLAEFDGLIIVFADFSLLKLYGYLANFKPQV